MISKFSERAMRSLVFFRPKKSVASKVVKKRRTTETLESIKRRSQPVS